MTLSLYLTVVGRSPQRHATLPTHQVGHSTSTKKYHEVLQGTTPVLLWTTKCYSSTTLYYKVLVRTTKYYSSITLYYRVLVRTTKDYSVLYYKVLLQYYSVLPSTTPYYKVLLCTLYYKVLLQYYSVLKSISPYYKVLLQYCSVLHRTTPVLFCTTI